MATGNLFSGLDALVFSIDTQDDNCFLGEPTINYAWEETAKLKSTYDLSRDRRDPQFDLNHPMALDAVELTDGRVQSSYVNQGVNSGNWQVTHHCHWQYDDEFKKPVMVLSNGDSQWKAKSFGVGAGAFSSIGMNVGDQYTISWWQQTNFLGRGLNTGLYTRNPDGQHNFWDGRQTGQNTVENKWERVSKTYTVTAERNLDDSYGTVYMYGQHGVGTILKVTDVQVEMKDHMTKFCPVLERTETQCLIDTVGGKRFVTPVTGYNQDGELEWDATEWTQYPVLENGDWEVAGDKNDWTMEHIVYYNQVAGGYDNVVSPANFFSSSSATHNSWYWSVLNNKLALWNISPGYWRYGDTILQPNRYYHVAIKCYNQGTRYQFYLNGVPEGGDHVNQVWNPDFSGLRVGNLGSGGGRRGIRGKEPVTKIYTRALSDEEIMNNFNQYKKRYDL